jgi:cytochrome c
MKIDLQRHGSGLLVCGLLLAACATASRGTSAPPTKGVEAQLCDGETVIALEAVPQTREEGQAAADAMMAAWKLKNPDGDWEQQVRASHVIRGSHDNSDLLDAGQGQGVPGRDFTRSDLLVWRRETERLVVAGARVFHSADELGSTIAVSCDMCHPDAANTHPETYPKYQVQIGRAALLRDMINWCLQHPVRAEQMAEDDPRMRALEAYIFAQRTGTPLAYGKH